MGVVGSGWLDSQERTGPFDQNSGQITVWVHCHVHSVQRSPCDHTVISASYRDHCVISLSYPLHSVVQQTHLPAVLVMKSLLLYRRGQRKDVDIIWDELCFTWRTWISGHKSKLRMVSGTYFIMQKFIIECIQIQNVAKLLLWYQQALTNKWHPFLSSPLILIEHNCGMWTGA